MRRLFEGATSKLCRVLLVAFGFPAYAGEPTVQNAPTPEPRFKLYGWVETGATVNPDDPPDGQNFGHLFTDRSNELLLNQAVITAERTLAVAGDNVDWGFRAQFLYGSDARYIHSLGLLDNTQHDIVQPDLVEAWMLFHLPIPNTSGGLDIKAGKFVTLEGAETIDPRTNLFYSHSYIFNFGIPFNHTGVLTILHLIKGLDLYAGVTRGVNTSITDNNGSVAFDGGVGLTLLDGKLTALATTHIGPENPHNNHDPRYLNDLVVTWKPTDKLTAILDANFAEDESVPGTAKAYGTAVYLTYSINDWLTLGLREEVFRDEKGFFVGSFAANDNFIDLERGKTNNIDPQTFFASGTFNGVTVGATIKVPVPKPLGGLTIRPELRYDAALSSHIPPFANQDSRHQFTASIDMIFTF
ncbi:MAG: porin [Chthoniobacterales bacterium]|nr:MAG: porin [Chthoniobacterales bacterium]